MQAYLTRLGPDLTAGTGTLLAHRSGRSEVIRITQRRSISHDIPNDKAPSAEHLGRVGLAVDHSMPRLAPRAGGHRGPSHGLVDGARGGRIHQPQSLRGG